MNIAVSVQSLLNLAVYGVQVRFLLLVAVVTLVDQTDAGVDTISSSLANVDSVVLQGIEYELHISAMVEYSIECHDRMFFAEFFENKHCAVFLHVVRLWVAILPQELDGHHGACVNGLGRVFATCFCENT